MSPLGQQGLPLRRAQTSARAGVRRAAIVHVGGCRQLPQFPAAAKTGIGQPLRLQTGQGRGIEIGAQALYVGRVGAAQIRASVPIQPQPAQIFQSGSGQLRPGTLGVNILQPQQQPPALSPRGQPCQKKSPGVAQVEQARRAGGQPAAAADHDKKLFFVPGHGCQQKGQPAKAGYPGKDQSRAHKSRKPAQARPGQPAHKAQQYQ